MSTATRSKHVFVALRMTQLERRRHGQEDEPKQRTFVDVSNDVLGMSRPTSTITRRDVRGNVTAVLLAIGMRLEGPDFHYGKRCVQAG